MFKQSYPGLTWLKWVPLVVLCDQLSKWWILTHLTIHDRISVLPGVKLILAQNRGVAFSLFDKHDGSTSALLLLFILGVVLTIMVWLSRTPPTHKWSGIALVGILGGAIGNLCDRAWHGYVVDFIDFSIGSWHWYTFNIADSFITMGAMIMIGAILFDAESPKESVCQKP